MLEIIYGEAPFWVKYLDFMSFGNYSFSRFGFLFVLISFIVNHLFILWLLYYIFSPVFTIGRAHAKKMKNADSNNELKIEGLDSIEEERKIQITKVSLMDISDEEKSKVVASINKDFDEQIEKIKKQVANKAKFLTFIHKITTWLNYWPSLENFEDWDASRKVGKGLQASLMRLLYIFPIVIVYFGGWAFAEWFTIGGGAEDILIGGTLIVLFLILGIGSILPRRVYVVNGRYGNYVVGARRRQPKE